MSNSRRTRIGKGQSSTAPTVSIATKALAVYGAYKLASWAWSKFTKSDKDEDNYFESSPLSSSTATGAGFHHQQRHHHSSKAFSRRRQSQLWKCNQETLCTLNGFLNTLKSTIESLTDFSQETKALKHIRRGDTSSDSTCSGDGGGDVDGDGESEENLSNIKPSKQELWDEIKVKSITRMVSTVYAHSLLTLLLTVQISLLGGRIFRQKLHVSGELGDDDDEQQVGESIDNEGASSHKQVLLKTYEYFFANGLESLVNDVKMVVEMNISDWKVIKDDGESVGTISLDQFDDRIQCIRKILDGMTFEKYINECDSDKSQQSVEVRFIFEETLDLLESPVFETARVDVLNVTFDVLQQNGYGILLGKEGNTSTEQKPLASIVTKLKKVINGFYASPDASAEDKWIERPMSSYPSIYLYHIDQIDSVKELSDVSFN